MHLHTTSTSFLAKPFPSSKGICGQCRQRGWVIKTGAPARNLQSGHRTASPIFCKYGDSEEEYKGKKNLFSFLPARVSKPLPQETEENVEVENWGFFEWSAYADKFEVPWGGWTLALGMGAWFTAAIVVGFAFIPQAVKYMGIKSFSALTQQEQALLLLETQALETIVGISIIFLATRRWQPYPSDIFKISPSDPFKKKEGWFVWAMVGIVLSLVANTALATVLSAAGVQEASGPGTVDAVANMVVLDFPTYLSLIGVVGVLAPFLEETVFRGFLLTTLTKWMPTPLAVIISSGMFGLAHFSPKDFPYLTTVGLVWGFMYVRSKNLLTPMLMHGAWNSTVTTLLFLLVSAGVDLKQAL